MKNSETIIYNVILIIFTISLSFVTPFLFQWLWNDAIIIFINSLNIEINNTIYNFNLKEMEYWISFLIINIIASIKGFFKTPNYEKKVKIETKIIFKKLIEFILNTFIAVLISVLLVKIIL